MKYIALIFILLLVLFGSAVVDVQSQKISLSLTFSISFLRNKITE